MTEEEIEKADYLRDQIRDEEAISSLEEAELECLKQLIQIVKQP